MKKYIPTVLIFMFGGIIGGIVSAAILVNYIESQRNQGFNTGSLKMGFDIIDFLDENIQNDISKIKKTDKYFTIKDAGIKIVEINGVKTVLIE